MGATTPKIALPYPAPADPDNVPADLQALATRIDTLWPGITSSLPASPVDGQECFYLADATNGIVWHLRYRTAAAGSYKWEYVGGPPLAAYVPAVEGRSAGTYGDVTTVGPSVTVPLAGDYDVFTSCWISCGATYYGLAAVAFGATVAADTWAVTSAGNASSIAVAGSYRFTAAAASSLVKLQYRGDGTNTANFGHRRIEVRPVRVG